MIDKKNSKWPFVIVMLAPYFKVVIFTRSHIKFTSFKANLTLNSLSSKINFKKVQFLTVKTKILEV